MAVILGYNTNGFAEHRLADAVAILSEIGYRSVAVTLERDHLNPPDRGGVPRCVELLRPLIEDGNLHLSIETGSRFILDPRRKHQPTLVSASPEGRQQRIEFLKAAIDIAASLAADSVSLWSGRVARSSEAGPRVKDEGGRMKDETRSPKPGAWSLIDGELFTRLTAGLRELLGYAETKNVRLSFEPEPGMFIDTMARFSRLHAALDHPLLGLTLDVGHIHCLGDGDLREHVHRWRDQLWNVHIEDMRRGVHEHLTFGQGDMDFASVFDALREIGYDGPVHVELPRHSHNAVEEARRSYEFLRRYI